MAASLQTMFARIS